MPSPYPFLEMGREAMKRALPWLTKAEGPQMARVQELPGIGRTSPPGPATLLSSLTPGEPARMFGAHAREERPFLASQGDLAIRFETEQIETAFRQTFGDVPPFEMEQLDTGEEVLALFDPNWVDRAKALGLILHPLQPFVGEEIFLFRIPDNPPTMGLPGGRDFPFLHE